MTSPTLLVSLDFDGTLSLDDRAPSVDPVIHHALRACLERDAIWLVNTGRSLPHTMEGLVEGRFPDRPKYLITRERDIHVGNAFGRWVPYGDWNARAEDAHRALFRKAKSLFKEVKRFLEDKTLATFLSLPEEPAGIVASNTAEMEDICAFINRLLPDWPDLRYERNSIYLRFSHRGYSKGSALAHLAATLGLTPSRVFAAGDNYNDLTMLDPAVAAHLACPSNALPMVRDHVARLGGFCSEQPGAAGVAEALFALLGPAEPVSG